jgi:hypothetical protein
VAKSKGIEPSDPDGREPIYGFRRVEHKPGLLGRVFMRPSTYSGEKVIEGYYPAIPTVAPQPKSYEREQCNACGMRPTSDGRCGCS